MILYMDYPFNLLNRNKKTVFGRRFGAPRQVRKEPPKTIGARRVLR